MNAVFSKYIIKIFSTEMSHSDDLFVYYDEFKELQKKVKRDKNELTVQEKCKLKDLKEKIIHNVKICQEGATQIKLMGIVAFVNHDYAKLSFVSEAEKESIALTTIEMLKPIASTDECLYIYLKLINFASFLLLKSDKLSLPQKLLEEAEAIYFNKKKENLKCSYYVTGEELFKNTQPNYIIENLTQVYKIVTSNIQVQAYIYYKVGNNYKFQLYENMVLQRQLESADGSPVLWAKKATSLAAHFLFKGMFVEARHHLAAAYVVLQYCEADMKKQGPNYNGKHINLYVTITELAKMWVKYSITLFEFSMENHSSKLLETELIPQLDSENCETKQQNSTHSKDKMILSSLASDMRVDDENDFGGKNKPQEDYSKGDAQEDDKQKQILFHSLNLESVESQVTAELIGGTEQARTLFQFSYAWLLKLKSYHMIRNLITGHTDCMMYLNELYKYLAHYEKIVECKYNVLKKRADTLDSLIGVLKENNLPLNVQLTIDYLRELSEVQLELILLNINKLSLENTNTESGMDNQYGDIKMHKMAAITRIHSKLDLCSRTLSESAIFVTDQKKKEQ